jgi:hypothetical protein
VLGVSRNANRLLNSKRNHKIMKSFDPASSFGENVATHYDDHLRGDEESAASFLSALAQGRPALEFAIGTGPIAIPLAEKGPNYGQKSVDNH